MDMQHLVAALEEALDAAGSREEDAPAVLDIEATAHAMAHSLIDSLHFRAWLAERLEATWQLAEVHGFSDQADDLCGGPLGTRIARNGARIS